jgi:hypothetical protein
MNAVMSMKGQGDMSVEDAIAMVHATSPDQRSKLAKVIWSRRREHGTDKVGAAPF